MDIIPAGRVVEKVPIASDAAHQAFIEPQDSVKCVTEAGYRRGSPVMMGNDEIGSGSIATFIPSCVNKKES